MRISDWSSDVCSSDLLPYEPGSKTKLAFWLVQARAMLGLIRNLTANRTRDVDSITFVARASYEAQLEQIGGLSARGLRDRALAVEKAISSIAAGLTTPRMEAIGRAGVRLRGCQ